MTHSKPCTFDHNGECLICDCFGSDCAYDRLLNQDYRWESKSELLKMFRDWIREKNLEYILDEKSN